MADQIILKKDSYCSGDISEISFQVINNEKKEITLSIPDLNFGEGLLYKFKLIIEEVVTKEQHLLGSNLLGKIISQVTHHSILIEKGAKLAYSHRNEYIFNENELIKSAVQGGILEENTIYSEDNKTLDGYYNIQIHIFQRTPQEPQLTTYEAPALLTDYEQKINTITVYVLLSRKNYDICENAEQFDASIYTGIGHLGFFIVDLDLFSEFIRKEIGVQPANLVELFTVTDLVDKCFNEGILIITWGVKPWHYHIVTDYRLLSSNCDGVISGSYKLRTDIKELSVISGNELVDWPACLEKKWPKIRLEGYGENVSLSLYLEYGKIGNEMIPTYVLQRETEEIDDIVPIINYNFLDS